MSARYCSSVCGRFTLSSPAETIAGFFGLADVGEVPELAPRYNIAPTQTVLAARAVERASGGPQRVIEKRRWGLVPHFAKEIAGPPLFNARAETLAERPAFRVAFRRHRCLVAADGFYEWQKVSGRRQPFYQRREDGAPFAMAGLYATWEPEEGDPVASCTIVTTEPNRLLAPLHDRMPVILPPEHWDAWLDPDGHDVAALGALLVPADDAGWVSYAVDTRVNRSTHDEPGNVEPLFDDVASAGDGGTPAG
jgi:putative SOS response-associated peptidase YedK